MLAGLAMFLILALMTSYSNAAVMAALGSSCFLIFALPNQPTSQPRHLIGGPRPARYLSKTLGIVVDSLRRPTMVVGRG